MRTEKTRLLRSGEVAKRLGLHPLTVRRWVKEGKIAAIPIGREARIPITEVERRMARTACGDHRPLWSGEFARAKRRLAATSATAATVGRSLANRTKDDDLDGYWLWSGQRAEKPPKSAGARPGFSGGRSRRHLLRSAHAL